MSNFWSVNDNFRYGGKRYHVKGIDIERNYQTDHEVTYLRYSVKVKGKWLEHWVDSAMVEKLEKPKRK